MTKFLVVTLLVIASAAAEAEPRNCDPRDGIVWSSDEATKATLAVPLAVLDDAVERARARLDIRAKIFVVPVDCPYWGQDIFTRGIMSGFGNMYGVYVSTYYLKYTPPDELERAGISEVCRVYVGATRGSQGPIPEFGERLVKRCLANIVGDQALLRWLERTSPSEAPK